eukprot:CAMPEP_0181112288 /NCGR_PEP_ID=MMETSP1071-20121207/19734_1 /TAXON_ID=35127 /ORGANISM="Thalassiosira sp., Strain NH16" /LENGTH=300 /DNA_ID=CAMNT_0023196249 /DNA_START=20 /DNA_END=923 /DNA_ORIENTATION=-
MKPLPLLLLLAIATLTTCLIAADVDAAPTPPPARRRFLRSEEENDATYDAILAMHNATFDHECYVSLLDGMTTVSSSTTPSSYPVVWCDISVPIGLNVTAEIRDGTCDEFSDAASSEYFTKGVASPILLPEVTEEEKQRGTFDHSYCAGMDVLYDVEGTGELVSVVRARFAMAVTFGYEEEEIHEGRWWGGGRGSRGGEADVREVVDENTKVKEEQMELRIGLGVLAGATITLALIAIIYGEKKKKKKARTRRRWEAYQRNLEMDDEEHEIEIARIKEDAAPGGEDEIFKIASVDENEII